MDLLSSDIQYNILESISPDFYEIITIKNGIIIISAWDLWIKRCCPYFENWSIILKHYLTDIDKIYINCSFHNQFNMDFHKVEISDIIYDDIFDLVISVIPENKKIVLTYDPLSF